MIRFILMSSTQALTPGRTPRRWGRGLFLYKVALAPLLKLQGLYVRKNVVRLPEPEGLRSGIAGSHDQQRTLRILVVGDSSAAGVGVLTQDDALASQIASAISSQTGQLVRWQLVAKIGTTVFNARKLLASHTLESADVLVFCLGGNDVIRQSHPRNFLYAYRNLVKDLSEKVGARLVVINGLPPMHILPATPQPLRWYLGQCAYRLDAGLCLLAASVPHFKYVSLQWAAVAEDLAIDRFHPGKGQYKEWAQRVADCVGHWCLEALPSY
jgi:lysophospholipase L1-like esterase